MIMNINLNIKIEVNIKIKNKRRVSCQKCVVHLKIVENFITAYQIVFLSMFIKQLFSLRK